MMNLLLTILFCYILNGKANSVRVRQVAVKNNYEEFDEHTIVSDSQVFPYVVALLRKSNYLSAGALIDASWVVTDADSLYFTREVLKTIRVRVGSINYKKGGLLVPVKLFHIHPYFDDKRPLFDIALVMLATPVRFTPNIYPVRLRNTPRDVGASHFIVTSWSSSMDPIIKSHQHVYSMEIIKRRRMLTVTHLHPSDPEECGEELGGMGVNTTDSIMCLDPGVKDPCQRDVGAPVVLNGILWGIISSWKPEKCDERMAGPILANLVSDRHVSTWLHSIIHGHSWENQNIIMDYNDID